MHVVVTLSLTQRPGEHDHDGMQRIGMHGFLFIFELLQPESMHVVVFSLLTSHSLVEHNHDGVQVGEKVVTTL